MEPDFREKKFFIFCTNVEVKVFEKLAKMVFPIFYAVFYKKLGQIVFFYQHTLENPFLRPGGLKNCLIVVKFGTFV